MRICIPLMAILLLSGCAAPVTTPRAYLDEETAATITVVADPWIFTGDQTGIAPNERDFLNMFAIDVNRMGEHRQYLAVLQSIPPTALSGENAPVLELQGGGRSVSLQHATGQPRELGIAKPLAPSYSMTSQWWYFPVSKDVLATVARSKDLKATLVVADKRLPYTIWRDGSEAITELTAVLP